MKLDEGDRLVRVRVFDEDQNVFLATRKGKCIRFPVTDVRVFSSRNSTGVRGIRLVDDDEVNSMILIRQIKKYNESLAIVQACNGEEALLKADCTHVDLIFMDMEMPVMGGLEATQKLREKGFVSPIYMVTGNIDQEHKALCLAAGATGHLPKPLDKKKMRSVLELY